MNEEYIKKLEETNKALEEALVNQEKSIDHYKRLRITLTVALANLRSTLYRFEEGAKRNEKADREFKAALKEIAADGGRYEISPFDIDSYEMIKQFIEEIEKSPIDKPKDSI